MSNPGRISNLPTTTGPSRDAAIPVEHNGQNFQYTPAQILGLMLTGDLPALTAAGITYDPAAVALVSTTVQAALDELADRALLDPTAAGAALATATDVAAQRSALGLGSAALLNATGPRRITTFASSGTYTKPAWLTRALIYVTGGGGGGGGASAGSGQAAAGGGGGGGGTAIKIMANAEIGATETVTRGAGGSAGSASGGTGGTGGASSFGAHVAANGGLGGIGGNGSTGVFATQGGSEAGATSGDFLFAGAPGAFGFVNGGGGQAMGGNGGSSYWGGGGLGRLSDAAGNVGAAPGGGGGGGSAANSTAAGGAGAAGIVVIFEFE